MARRNGIPTLYRLALRMCNLLDRFYPILAVQYSGNAALLAALAAAQSACGVLAVETNKVRDVETAS